MAHLIERLQAAAVDGRAHNIYYRQTELQSLCRSLLDNGDQIRQAIKADYGDTDAEVAVEFSLTISTIKQHYASLQSTKAHEEEYLIAQGKDAPNNRTPAGIVYIEPTWHTLFYSLLVPLSAAVAAGNCVIVLVSGEAI
jgi:acyl-CoA reductase-like NAD-dependent aldehyde dehydrogenase